MSIREHLPTRAAAAVLLLLVLPFPATAQYLGLRPDAVFSCDTRPLERPRPVSRQGAESLIFATIWGTARNDVRLQVVAPFVSKAFDTCRERALEVDAEAWHQVAPLVVSAEPVDDDAWDVRTRFGDAERTDRVSSNDTPPWEMAETINGWVLEQVEAGERPALRDALWTLWIEGFLSTLPKSFFGHEVGDLNHYSYVDALEAARERIVASSTASPQELMAGGAYRPGFQPLFSGRRILVDRALDPALVGAYEGREVTSWNGRPIADWDRDELYDFWVREEPFDYTFQVDGREEPIEAHSRPYGLPWDVAMGFYGATDKVVAYVRIAEFVPVTAARLRELILPPLHEYEVAGLVVDLRGNPGGFAQPEALELLFARGVTTMTSARPLQKEPENAVSSDGTYADVPLVVLVDGETASMAEVFAAAVRRHERGVLVGERTYGKASSQFLYPLYDEGILSMTRSLHFYPGTHATWQGKGIDPHIEVTQGPNAEIVAKALRRPIVDLGRLYHYDPVYKRAMQLFLGAPGEWERLLKPSSADSAEPPASDG